MAWCQGGNPTGMLVTPISGYAKWQNVPQGLPAMWVSLAGILGSLSLGIIAMAVLYVGYLQKKIIEQKKKHSFLLVFWLYWLAISCFMGALWYFWIGTMASRPDALYNDPIAVIYHANAAGILLTREMVAFVAACLWCSTAVLILIIGHRIWLIFYPTTRYLWFLALLAAALSLLVVYSIFRYVIF